MAHKAVTALQLLLLAAVLNQLSLCDEGNCTTDATYTKTPTGCYMLVTGMKHSWNYAVCPGTGAHLAIIKSAEHQGDVKTVLDKTSDLHGKCPHGIWIGGKRETDCRSNKFNWQPSGLAFDYTDWAPGEPNCLSGPEWCVALYTQPDKYLLWDDYVCYYSTCFLCQID